MELLVSKIIPSVGSKGCFSLLSPFDVLIVPEKLYTVQAIRSIHEMVINGDEPYESIYENNGLDQEDFSNALTDNERIITLIGDGNEIIYIPSTYFLSYPLLNGVVYHGQALSIDLGIIPASEDVSYIKDMVRDLVKDTIGIEPSSELVTTSAEFKVGYDDHDAIVALRNSIKNSSGSYRSRYLSALTMIDSLSEQISLMECFISNNCCGTYCGDSSVVIGVEETIPICEIMQPDYSSAEMMFLQSSFGIHPCESTVVLGNQPPPDVFPELDLFEVAWGYNNCQSQTPDNMFLNTIVNI